MKHFFQPLFFILPLASYAQKYHDAMAFGQSGHVKEIISIDVPVFL